MKQTVALMDLREGDSVAVLTRKRNDEDFTPSYLGTVKKVTAKFIETATCRFFRETGMPANRYSQAYRLSADPAHILPFKDKAEIDKAIREAKEQAIKERDARITFQLACQIVNQIDPMESVARLENLGEDRLRMILEWLENKGDNQGKGQQ